MIFWLKKNQLKRPRPKNHTTQLNKPCDLNLQITSGRYGLTRTQLWRQILELGYKENQQQSLRSRSYLHTRTNLKHNFKGDRVNDTFQSINIRLPKWWYLCFECPFLSFLMLYFIILGSKYTAVIYMAGLVWH